jgi:stearoyl-CoA desaturase (Delta-9 desaturase)
MSGSQLQPHNRFLDWLQNRTVSGQVLTAYEAESVDWFRVAPFALIHIACAGALLTGVSTTSVIMAVSLYIARMFFITAFYHRYFSHRSYQAGRRMQFAMAVLGCTAGQRGPLWWAAHHREHHLSSDTVDDPHSPAVKGFWFSHTIWFLTKGAFALPEHRVRDWMRFPELVWLERFEWVPFVSLALMCYGLGSVLQAWAPAAETTGVQMLVVGFFWSTVALYHGTYATNSLAHLFGQRRFNTSDSSRNNAFVALITLGEGWHNNHHFYPVAARHGFQWWELDVSWMGLRVLHGLGLISNFKLVPQRLVSAATREPKP